MNPLYLCIDHASGYIEKKNGNEYLDFDSAGENKPLLEKYTDPFNGIKDKNQINN